MRVDLLGLLHDDIDDSGDARIYCQPAILQLSIQHFLFARSRLVLTTLSFAIFNDLIIIYILLYRKLSY